MEHQAERTGRILTVIVQNSLDVIIALDNVDDLSGAEMFALADALDGYEVEMSIEEKLVIDIVEMTSAGVFAVHVIPKQMMTYEEIMAHINGMVSGALKRDGIPAKEYSVKKVLFRTKEPGKPSETLADLEEIKAKVDTLWKDYRKEDMKSYV
jgi:hypothetical protein